MTAERTHDATSDQSAAQISPRGIGGFLRAGPDIYGRKFIFKFSALEETIKYRRPKGEESLTVLPNGHYKMTISIRVDVAGNEYPKVAKLYPLFLLAISTGMRFGELLGVSKDDIDMSHGIIDINKQSTSRSRKAKLKTASSYRRIFVQQRILEVVLEATKGELWRNFTYISVVNRVNTFFGQCSRLHLSLLQTLSCNQAANVVGSTFIL